MGGGLHPANIVSGVLRVEHVGAVVLDSSDPVAEVDGKLMFCTLVTGPGDTLVIATLLPITACKLGLLVSDAPLGLGWVSDTEALEPGAGAIAGLLGMITGWAGLGWAEHIETCGLELGW